MNEKVFVSQKQPKKELTFSRTITNDFVKKTKIYSKEKFQFLRQVTFPEQK